MNKVRRLIMVKGIVQGVGFRPFIYRLAFIYELHGWVNNSSEGVIIDVEGILVDIKKFIRDIKSNAPSLANIEELDIKELSLKGYDNFSIKKSRDDLDNITLISPDIAICSKCKQEISDINNRRYHYPFTNCTECGPRYSIITDLPYDRPKTTMDSFEMCDKCKEEYHNPLNRRFHAQGISCPECGPELCLTDNQGNKLNVDDPLKETAGLLKKGKIVAIKGLGGFHLACDAFNQSAVRELRKRKGRPDKPFALMMRDREVVRGYCYLSPEEEEILTGIRKPILLLGHRFLASDLSPDNNYIGVMLPYTSIHELLFHYIHKEREGAGSEAQSAKNDNQFENVRLDERSLKALVMTSANISGMPLEYTNQGTLKRLNKIADYFLLHNRDIKVPVDDSVSQILLGKERLIRRARGYAPQVIKFPGLRESLACGSYLKNTIALVKDDYIFLSQHLGDISNLESYQYYKEVVAHFKRIYQIDPQIIAHDFHTGYLSSQFAQIQKGRKVRVQHHHAHIVSCMVDNEISEDVIGLAFDGTGLGTDDSIWGGEFLICDYACFKRVGQLKYVKMPGGDEAVKEPWRMAVSYLYHTYGDNLGLMKKTIVVDDNKVKNEKKVNIIIKLLKTGLNAPQTSSMGRLFDAVASLLGLGNHITYQAQAAIKLEAAASEGFTKADRSALTKSSSKVYESYNYQIVNNEGYFIVNTLPIIKCIVRDIVAGVSRETIARRFHNTVIDFSVSVCELIREKYQIDRVALSGGVFQNRVILEGIYKGLREKGFIVYIHSRIPCNDGGLSVGQLVIANYMRG